MAYYENQCFPIQELNQKISLSCGSFRVKPGSVAIIHSDKLRLHLVLTNNKHEKKMHMLASLKKENKTDDALSSKIYINTKSFEFCVNSLKQEIALSAMAENIIQGSTIFDDI